jgi:hypothetical protein
VGFPTGAHSGAPPAGKSPRRVFSNTGAGFNLVGWRASVPAEAMNFADTTVGGKLALLPMPPPHRGRIVDPVVSQAGVA